MHEMNGEIAVPHKVQVKTRISVPANPDISAVVESVLLDKDGSNHVLALGADIHVTRELALQEHGSTKRYRERLLLQLLKRRWFGALTEFHSRILFATKAPRHLAEFVRSIQDRVLAELRSCKEDFAKGGASDDGVWTLARLIDEGAVRLVLKGGLALSMLKLQALRMLPGDVAATLSEVKPRELSDIDFTLLLGAANGPAFLKDASLYGRLHKRCCELAESALLTWVRHVESRIDAPNVASTSSLSQDSSTASPPAAPPSSCAASRAEVAGHTFDTVSAFFAEAEGPGKHVLGAELAKRLNAATGQLRRELFVALRARGLVEHASSGFLTEFASPASGAASRAEFAELLLMLDQALRMSERCGDGAGVLPCRRRESLHISVAGSDGEVTLEYVGTERRFYVSVNPVVTFKDHSCGDDEIVAFSLLRVMMPFRLDLPKLPAVLDEEDESGAPLSLSRGETIDISVPMFEDVQCKKILELERSQAAFARPASFRCEGVEVCRTIIESLDSLLLEQRNLTFGPKMQSLLIWRIGKVGKRLGRLVELLGIKAMVLPVHVGGWHERSQAFLRLETLLLGFVRSELLPSLQRRTRTQKRKSAPVDPTADPAPVPAKRPRTRLRSSIGGVPTRQEATTSTAKARRSSIGALPPRRGLQPGEGASLLAGTSSQAAPRDASAAESAADGSRDLWDLAGVRELLLEPLDRLSLKVFSDAVRPTLPSDFAERWNEVLKPLARKARLFSDAFEDLARQDVPPLEEAALYNFELSSDWGF